jgi:hypothetical protein
MTKKESLNGITGSFIGSALSGLSGKQAQEKK